MKKCVKRIAVLVLAMVVLFGIIQLPTVQSISEDYDLLVMSSNVLFDDSYDTEYRMHCLAQTYLEYMPDVLCLQEARANQTAALYPLLAESYTAVPLEQYATDSQQIVYQQILYRTELYEVVEAGFERFREDVFPWGVSWVVFRSNQNGKQFCVMSTHLSIISSTYDPGATNTIEGVQLRRNDCGTILATAEAVRQSYPGIPILVGGDWNEIYGSPSLEPIDESVLLTNAMEVAAVADTTINSSHELCRMPVKGGDIIDHFYVTTDSVTVKEHAIIADGVVIQGSDHCPIYVKITLN